MHFLSTHIKKGLYTFSLGAPHAAVMVRIDTKNKTLTVETDKDKPFLVLRNDAELCELPAEYSVIVDGKTIKASGVFLVTIESFDPYHGLCDVSREKMKGKSR